MTIYTAFKFFQPSTSSAPTVGCREKIDFAFYHDPF